MKREKDGLILALEECDDKYQISLLESEQLKEKISQFNQQNIEYRTIIENNSQEILKLKNKLKVIDEYEETIDKLNQQIKLKNQETSVNKKAILNLQNALENLQV